MHHRALVPVVALATLLLASPAVADPVVLEDPTRQLTVTADPDAASACARFVPAFITDTGEAACVTPHDPDCLVTHARMTIAGWHASCLAPAPA